MSTDASLFFFPFLFFLPLFFLNITKIRLEIGLFLVAAVEIVIVLTYFGNISKIKTTITTKIERGVPKHWFLVPKK